MTYEELEAEAKRQGYTLIRSTKEKLLPCVCGSNRRTHWRSINQSGVLEQLICCKCGFEGGLSHTATGARREWNKAVREASK